MRQSRSALSAPARQHLAAVRRAHPLAEARFLASLPLLRLIGSEHFSHLACPVFKDIHVDFNYIPCNAILSIDIPRKFAHHGVQGLFSPEDGGRRKEKPAGAPVFIPRA